jgi:glutamate synthase (NADPH/NADH) large chain
MSGGYAYVLDLDRGRVNDELVDVEPLTDEDSTRLRAVIETHVATTASAVGAALLADWPDARPRFSAIVARDFRRVVEATRRATAAGEDVDEAVMAVAKR